jgi:hypothetical protein
MKNNNAKTKETIVEPIRTLAPGVATIRTWRHRSVCDDGAESYTSIKRGCRTGMTTKNMAPKRWPIARYDRDKSLLSDVGTGHAQTRISSETRSYLALTGNREQ